jgi:anthranilate synthase component 2
MRLRVIMVDNFDSFTFNLVDEFAKRDCAVEVWRNDVPADHLLDRVTADTGSPALLVVSPGPGTPAAAGCSIAAIRLAAGRVPIFGVCLGHQAIIEAFGGEVGPAGEILHGRSSVITHENDPLFEGVPSPCTVGRYHSLAGCRVGPPLRVIARSGEIVMAVRHDTHSIVGVQFHPESILTPFGGTLVENVIRSVTEPRE